jgi:hypothetical protein
MENSQFKNPKKLQQLKLLHTVVWYFYLFVFLYVLVTLLIDKVNIFTYIGIALIVLEGVILLLNGWRCPITKMAEKHIDDELNDHGFDIHLPYWLAKHNKTIFTSLFVFEVILLMARLVD